MKTRLKKRKKKSNPSNKSGERSFVIKQIKRRRHYRAVIFAFRLYISLADRFAGSFSYLFSQDNTWQKPYVVNIWERLKFCLNRHVCQSQDCSWYLPQTIGNCCGRSKTIIKDGTDSSFISDLKLCVYSLTRVPFQILVETIMIMLKKIFQGTEQS